MKQTIKSIAAMALAILAMFSCQKDSLQNDGLREEGGVPVSGGQITLSVDGLMGEYQAVDGTRSELVNTVRVAWEAGDTVYAYNTKGFLGILKATLDGDDDRYARLSGTIGDPAGERITLVHSTLITESNKESVFANGKLSLSIAAQDGKNIPFVVYGTLDVSGEVSNVIVPFKFATSVMNVNCTGLDADVPVSKAELTNVNTECVLTLNSNAAATVSADVPGTITRTGNEAFSISDERAIFQMA